MLVFDATYNRHHAGRGSYTEFRSAIVVANTKLEALGMLLTEYTETLAEAWELEPIDTRTPHVRYMDHGEI